MMIHVLIMATQGKTLSVSSFPSDSVQQQGMLRKLCCFQCHVTCPIINYLH